MKTPNGSPACRNAAARPRNEGGTASASMPWPIAHSPPMPMPWTIRPRKKTSAVGADPQIADPTE
jgi:hypothetical protein